MSKPRHPTFQLSPTALVATYPRRQTVFGRWHRIFGCWVQPGQAAPADHFIPHFPLLDTTGAPILSSLPRDPENRIFEALQSADLDAFGTEILTYYLGDKPDDENAGFSLVEEIEGRNALAQYFGEIPIEVRILAGQFDRWQWAILWACWKVPAFADFVASELRNVRRNYLCACFTLGRLDRIPRHHFASFVTWVMTAQRAHVLGHLLGFPIDRRAVKLVSKFRWRNESREDAVALIEQLIIPANQRVLRHLDEITPRHLEVLHWIPEALHTPNIIEKLTALIRDDDVSHLEYSHRMLFELRDAQEIRRVVNSLNSAHTVEAFELRYEQLERRLSPMPQRRDQWLSLLTDEPVPLFPAPPIPGDRYLIALQSPDELLEESQTMKHCVRGLYGHVYSGQSYFYKWLGKERGTVELRYSERTNGWSLGQHLGPENTELSAETRSEILRRIREQLDAKEKHHQSRPPGVPF